MKLKARKKRNRKVTVEDDFEDEFQYEEADEDLEDDIVGALNLPLKEPDNYWQALQEFPKDDDIREILRSIPDDMADALDFNPVIFFATLSRLHSLVAHWNTRYAMAVGRYSMAKSARDIGLEALKADCRKYLNRHFDKVTEGMVTEKAKATEEYARLCYGVARAETEKVRVSGLVEALQTKKDSLRNISFFLKGELDLADWSFTTDLSKIQDSNSPGVQALKNISRKMSKLVKEAKD